MTTVRTKRWTRRLAIPLATAVTLLAVVVAGYAFFSAPGSGSGTAFTGGSLGAPDIDPLGAPDFDVVNMVPGDTATQSVSVTTHDGGPIPSKISIYESSASGVLLPELSLKVVEDGTTTVYDGPLDTTWTEAAPLELPGNAADGTWQTGELHSFVFTVTFAASAGNEFQSTNALASFVWVREQGA